MRTILAALLLAPLFAQDADVQKVIQQLGSSSFEEQGKAATILEGLGREALPDLETATKSGNAQIRDWAVKIKARIEKRLADRNPGGVTPPKPAPPGPAKGLKLEAAAGWTSRYPSRTAPRDKSPADDAVLAALRWLARHQSPDGLWGAETFLKQCSPSCGGPGERDYDTGLTAISLLAFLGAGHTMDSKEPVDANFPGRTFGQAVQRGLTWLITHQDPEGCLGERGMKYVYNHAIAALALTEAYLMTGAADLKEAADKAVQFTIAAQNPGKGWRYSARCGDNDTSVTGWGALGLKAGELAGFDVPRKSFDGAVAWLSEAAEEKFGFITGYNARGTGKVYVPGKNEQFDHHPTMTAIGIFLRAMITKRRSDPPFIGVETVLEDPPAWRTNVIDFYYWHWASLAVHQVEPYGPKWKKWYDAVKKALLEGQRPATEACRRGSWDPEMERWGGEGGRVYATAIGALVLETPYRYPVFVTDTKSLPKKK